MSRVALARKHRPRTFSEIVGQDHVAATLRAAVERDRVGHAYLFCGPRGVGKTTTARVLAMALNCPRRQGGDPCGECESCERIWSGRTSLDVVEIDAASNRGVDDARDLRERAMYAPSEDERFKVYIVDEAHMLTREAWNALLKILEEPPSRVIFAFATTEPQKIQQTAPPVLSRCQRFDFRRVSVSQIVDRLRTVLEREGVEADDRALLPVARRAEGGVRDALSLLDQVLSFAGDSLGTEDVRRTLGLVEEERYLELLELIRAGDRSGVFPFVQGLVDEGYDLAEFVRGLGEAVRALLVLRSDPEGESLDLLPGSRERFAGMAARFEEVDLIRLLLAVSDFEASGRFRRSAQQRVQLEVLLLRLVNMDSAVEIDDLLAAVGGEVPESGRRMGPSAPEEADPDAERAPAPGVATNGGSGGDGDDGDVGEPGGRHSAPEDGAGDDGGGDEPRAGSRAAGELTEPTEVTDTFEPAEATEPAEVTEPTEPTGPTGPTEPTGQLGQVWQEALRRAEGLGGVGVALRGASADALEGNTLHLRVPPGLGEDVRDFLDHPRRSVALRAELTRLLELDRDALEIDVVESDGGKRITPSRAREQRTRGLASMDPRLREAVEKLDLEVEDA